MASHQTVTANINLHPVIQLHPAQVAILLLLPAATHLQLALAAIHLHLAQAATHLQQAQVAMHHRL